MSGSRALPIAPAHHYNTIYHRIFVQGKKGTQTAVKNYLFKPHDCCCFQAVDGPQHIGVSGYVLNQLSCQMIQSEVEMTDYGLSVERGLSLCRGETAARSLCLTALCN